MHDFCYVSKKEAAPVKAELLDIIHEVQDIVRDDFTFQFTFIGSSSRNMIPMIGSRTSVSISMSTLKLMTMTKTTNQRKSEQLSERHWIR